VAITAPAVAATGVSVPNTTGETINVNVTGGTVQGILSTPNPAPAVTTPAVPATTVAATNNNAFPVAVTVTGGTVTVIAVNGSTVFTATGNTVVVPAGGTVALTYSVAPTWVWSPLYAGAAGAPLSSPLSIPVMPTGAVSLIYTVAPTWTWTNPPVFDEVGYAGENTSQNNPLAWPWEPAHSEAGQTGLGAGVSN
jgi:hypothetical protein